MPAISSVSRCVRSRAAASRSTAAVSRRRHFPTFRRRVAGARRVRLVQPRSSSPFRRSSKAARMPIRIAGRAGRDARTCTIGAAWATGLHQVDNPVFDATGNLFVTYSGSRGQEAPVSIFRVTPRGTREPFASGIVNATSMAFGPDGQLYVSSRFEGAVYRVDDDGLARAGGVGPGRRVRHRVRRGRRGCTSAIDRARSSASATGARRRLRRCPPSVAAFHLAMSPERELFVTAPTLTSYDYVYRIDRQGQVRHAAVAARAAAGTGVRAGRHAPRGRRAGRRERRVPVHGLDADAGARCVSGAALVGLAFGPHGEMVVASNETAYRFD